MMNQQNLTIGTTSFDGPIHPRPFDIAPAVGAFIFSEIRFPQGRAGNSTAIEIDLVASMIINVSEKILIHLPFFAGSSRQIVLENSSFSVVSWNSSEAVLELVASQTLHARSSLSVVVPQALGIMLPRTGIATNSKGILISTASLNGPVLWTHFHRVKPVGFFSNSAVAVQPPIAGRSVSVTVSFTAFMDLNNGSSVDISLPAFHLNSSGAPSTRIFNATVTAGTVAPARNASRETPPRAPRAPSPRRGRNRRTPCARRRGRRTRLAWAKTPRGRDESG